jgi:hypothetical protein
MGDARGLLLCLSRLGERWGEESATPVTWGVFPTECTVDDGGAPGRFGFEGYPYFVDVG